MPMKWRFAWALVLALVASPAFALGLGQIQVRSQYGEPFLAEIPIVSSDPAELRQLQARLASPDTFARIGLQPPEGLVRNLQFNVALDASGRPVIRVTSAEPVDQPLLTFLIEADWGQGRLVREYSALLDAPDTIAAPAQPPIQAPVPDQGDRIVRPPAPAPEAADADGVDTGVAAPDAQAPDAQAVADAPEPDVEPQPAEAADPDAPATAEAGAPAPAPSVAPPPGQYGPIRAGDTLSQIVQQMSREADVSSNQMMLALLRTNPDAFIGGNINLIREGAVLRVPDRDETQRLSRTEATAEVRSQVARWREMSAPRPQPADAAVAQAGQGQETVDDEAGQAPGPTADARLEIAPPSPADGQQAGTRSGITAGGEGEMLRQQLQETRESLAARDAEVDELRARLADLEQIQQQQQQLITLKDSELAAVQQRLAESNQEAGPTLAQANQAQAGTPAPQDAGGGGPGLWIGLGLVLVIAAALAWVRIRRDRAAVPSSGYVSRSAGASADRSRAAGRAGSSPTWHGGVQAPAAAAAPGGPEPPPADAAPPAVDPPVDSPVQPATDSGAPFAEPGRVSEPAPEPAEPVGPATLTGMAERLELARAYVELGDVETARELLKEVAAAGAMPESDEAARLLQELA